MDRQKFIEQYASHLRDGQVALFVGAGLSMHAGYPSWRDLLKDIAAKLDLDLKREPDLPGLVQLYLNHVNKTRDALITEGRGIRTKAAIDHDILLATRGRFR